MSEQFKLDYPDKSFMLLHANFWDSLQKISRHHQVICKYLMQEISKGNEEENKNNEKRILTTTKSLKSLVEIDFRYYYLLYLKYTFFVSQPLTLNQLKTNFKNKIFPYYLFTILVKKKDINHLIIDFIERKILIYNKDKKMENISQEKIFSVKKKMNTSIIITMNESEVKSDKKKDIEIFPEFFQQIDLIYTIIDFFAKNGKNENVDSGEGGPSLLGDDTYVPKGILLRCSILKEHQNKLLSKDKRYAVLGSSQIIIFKDETMKEIRNVIPLLPFSAQLISDDKDFVLTMKYFYRDQALTFFDEDTYLEWKNKLKDIFNKKIVEKIDGIVMYQIKEKKLNSKILNLINEDIEELEEKISKNKDYLENFKISFVQEKNEN
jgi:hypothetical protein